MKTLYESLLDSDLVEKTDENLKKDIERFIIDAYGCRTFKISKTPNTDGKYKVSSPNIIKVKNRNITSLTNGLFVWDKVKSFDCSSCGNLTSLEGAPREVKDHFFCAFCYSLTSLKGAPEKVGKNFNCTECLSLTSLEGAPKEVGEDFTCMWCGKLESLEGAPEKVKSFDCVSCRSLTSLKGAPKEVGGDFRYWRNDECKVSFTEEDIKKVSNVKGYISC